MVPAPLLDARATLARRRAVDWLSLGALPIGLVFFAGTALGVLRRRAGHVAARADYPVLARELGLAHRPSRYTTGVGTLSGTIEGFKLVVDPDEQRRVWLSWPDPPGFVLYRQTDAKRPPPGYAPIRFKNPRVAAFFSTTLATAAAAGKFPDGDEFEPFVRSLANLSALKDASITSAGISLSFDFGSPPFIPADVVRRTIPAMISLARSLSSR
jgi:hypothetical protein